MANSSTIASQTIAEAVENSLNAYNIISKKNLDAVSYDETIKCKIVDITNRDLGEYRVTDGVSTYTAYSEKTDYYKGCLVWVTIPQGNYNNQKLISGKYIESDNSEPYAYISPLDSFIDLTSNLIEPGTVQDTGLIANGVSIGKPKEVILWSIQGRQLVGYERLAIQASFKSALKNVKTGTYGLRLDIFGREMGTSQTSNDRTIYSIDLNTNDFFGDPYNFETFYPQVKVVDISMIKCIDTMVLTFYQGQNFFVENNKSLTYSIEQQENMDLSNIWVNSPYISLGYSLDKFKTDTVLLYSLDSSTYASYLSEDTKNRLCEALNEEDFDNIEQYEAAKTKIKTDDHTINDTLELLNKKTMHIRWVHFEEGKDKPTIIGPDLSLTNNNENSILPDGAVLHWYQYKLEEGVKDPLAGVYWTEISSDSVDEDHPYNLFQKTFYPDKDLQSEKFKVIIELPSQEAVSQNIYDSYGNKEAFWDTSKEPPVNYYPEGETLLEDETYFEWVNRGLDILEEKKKEVIMTLGNSGKIEILEDQIYQEYLEALNEAGLTATQAEANSINEIYRKKMMNIKISLEEERDIYINLYNDILKALSGVTYYYSDVLEFTNEDQVPNKMTIQLLKGLELNIDDNYHGNYKIYNEEGRILSKKESQKKRTVTANWTSIVTGDRGLDGIERIEWYIPVNNTMIEYPQQGIEYSAYDEYLVEDKIHYDSVKNTPLYVYNKERNSYDSVVEYNIAYSTNEKYYIKNNTTFSEPTAEHPDSFLICRAGKTFEGHIPGTEEPSASGQVFRIKEFYNQTLINNTIKCIVWKNNSPFEASIDLIFGPVGTNGTDYTFELEIANKIQALTANQSPASSIVIIPHLYDYTGQDIIKQYKNKLKYSWWSPQQPTIQINGTATTITEEGPKQGQKYWTSKESDGSIILTLPADITIEQAQYHIIYAELTDAVDIGYQDSSGEHQSITLTTFRPIPIRSSERYVSIDGADKVAYDSSGVNPSYYKDPYNIYVYNNKKTIPIEEDTEASECPITWEISLGSDTVGAVAGSTARNFYPTLSDGKALIPPSFFLQDNGKQIAVNCRDKNHQIIWTQPLYIYQNSYTSAMLNSWDGKLTIDEESGIILSTAVGAGAKDEKNRYNGVLMGDLRGVDQTPTFGLYGYNEGVQSFGLKIDGTAFIGKAGKGQINFDGNSGRISSLSYNLVPDEPQGMLIDLDDGYIDAYGANLNKIRYSKDNKKYTIDEVLNYQKTILTDEITKYNIAISELNVWADKVLIQKYTNRKEEAQNKYNKALAIIQTFSDQIFLNDYEKLKFLQDNNATYLINDDVFTPEYTPSHSRIRFSTTDPYLLITSEAETDLMRVSREAYFLQTDNFAFAKGEKALYPYQDSNYLKFFKDNDAVTSASDYGTGMLFDLSHGYLLGYNFKLKGVNNGQEGDAQSRAMKDSYFELNSSGNPFLVVHLKTTYEPILSPLKARGLLSQNDTYLEKDLMWISRDKFFLQSFNYFAHKADVDTAFVTTEIAGMATHAIDPKKVGAGVLLDLTGGKLIGHDFEISAVDTGQTEPAYTGSYVYLGSGGAPYFRIHYQNVPDAEDRANYSDGSTIWNKVDNNGVKINQNIDLINISKSAWEINSKDFQQPNNTTKAIGKGIHFDLEGNHQLSLNSNGSANRGAYIEAYSFGLDAYRPGLHSQDNSSRIRINSAASGSLDTIQGPLISYAVNYDYLAQPLENKTYKTEQEIWNLIENRYSNETAKEKFLAALELKEGSLNLSPIIKKSKDFIDHPLMIGGLFSVSWDGKVEASYIEATQGGKIGPYVLSSFALYTNNGLLANGKPFIPIKANLSDAEKYGVYLGKNGISFSDKLVIYRSPINRYYQSSNTSNNSNTNYNHTLQKVIGFDTSTGKVTTIPIYDYVTSGDYTGATESDKDSFLNVGGPYDQIFQVDGNSYALKDLSFFLNGNSVLNGKTAINGNTYIYGNLQLGVPIQDISAIGNNPMAHTVSAYADLTLYGIFRSTGKSYIGAYDGRWFNDSTNLYETGRQNSATNIQDGQLGFIVYRNSYIGGYLKVGGSMVVGDCERTEITDKVRYSGIDNLHGDFTAYVKRGTFYGDLSVGAGFIAGSLNEDAPINNDFPKVPQADPDADDVAGSGIRSKNIFLGRNPGLINGNTIVQSKLNIYANTEQWGSFIAGRKGEKIELYACSDYANSRDSVHSAHLIMNNEGIKIRTYKDKPFELLTNGGNVTIDGRETSGTGATVGGSIFIYGGTGAQKDILLSAGDDFIKFEGYNDGALGKRSKLIIKSTGSFSLTIKGAAGDSTFNIDSSGMKIKLENSLDFSITATQNGVTNEFSVSQDRISLKRGSDDEFSMSTSGTIIRTKSADFSITAGSGTNINRFAMNSSGIEITSFAASFSLTAGDNRFVMGDSGITLTTTAANLSLIAGENQFTMSDSGITIATTAANFSLTAGENQFTMNDSGITIKASAGPSATFNASGIRLDLGNGDGLSLTKTNFSLKAGNASLTGTPDGGEDGKGQFVLSGTTRIQGNIYADNLNYTPEGKLQMGNTPPTPTLGQPGTFTAGPNGIGIGGWILNELTLENEGHTIGLDPKEARIWFNGQSTDYVDGAGKGSGATGIRIYSANAVGISGRNGVYINTEENSYQGNSGLTVQKDHISLSSPTVLNSSGEYLYLGTLPSSGTPSGGGSSTAYYLKYDGTAFLKGLKIGSAMEFKEDGTVIAQTLKGYGTGDSVGNLKIEANELTLDSKGMHVKYNGNDILTADNTEFTILRDVIVGDGSTVRNVIMKKGSLTLNSGDLKLTSGDIETQGTISGKNLYITSDGKSSSSTKYLQVTSAGVYIDVSKNNKGWINLSSSLGKLAFADDIKKKFKLNFSYRNSSGNTEYITTLNSKDIYTLKSSNSKTIYKMKSSPKTIYKAKTSSTNIYKRTSNSIPTLYTRSVSGYHYTQGSSVDVYGYEFHTGSDTTYGGYFSSDYIGTYYTGGTTYTEYDWSPVSMSDYYTSASITDVAETASITDIAETASITDIADKRKFTWSLDKTSNLTTFVDSNGEINDTIELTNKDFSNPISLTITSTIIT